jgi:hypothetical protein
MARRATATLTTGVGLALALSAYASSASSAPAGPELLEWLAQNTDMAAAQVVIAGPKYVYSLQPGPRASTGEEVALVRTERLEPGTGAASWEAHLLFDCAKARLREIRGTTFPQANRKGAPSPDPPSDAWIQPEPGQPAMQLLSAACDPAFAWPLRAHLDAEASPARALLLAPAETADSPPPSQPIVVAQGPAAVPPGVPPPPPDLMPAPAVAPAASAPQPPPAASPAAAAPSEPSPADEPAAPAPLPARSQPQTILIPSSSQATPGPAAPQASPTSPAPAGGYDVQVARGPSQDGASRALERARNALGTLPAGAFGRVEADEDRGRPRYTAILAGFPTPEAAVAACGVLQAAGQTCFVRNLPKAPEPAIANRAPKGAHAVQVARGPSQDGAKRALMTARRTLGPTAENLTGAIEESRVGSRRRFTAVLAGFASDEAADAACDTLIAAGQLCLTRSPEAAVAANETR